MHTKTPELLVGVVKDIIKGAEYGFFVTLGKNGQPVARLMQPYEPEEDLTIWLGASPRSRKIEQLRANNRATLAFYHSESTSYATLMGTAEIIDSPDIRRKYWRAFWSDIYPGGPEGDDYVVIKFRPQRVELMNFGGESMPQPYGLRPDALIWRGDAWVLLENEDLY